MANAVIIDWYGPYKSVEKLKQEANSCIGRKWLYAGFSSSPQGMNPMYIGLSTNPSSRFNAHHKLPKINGAHLYLGEIRSAFKSGPRTTKTPTEHLATENALIYFLKPQLNERSLKVPKDCVSIFSRFFGKNNWYKPKPTPPGFPELIAYNSYSEEWLSTS